MNCDCDSKKERKDCDIKKCVYNYLKFIGAKELYHVTSLISGKTFEADVEPFVFATIYPVVLLTHLSIQKNTVNEDPDHATVVNACKIAISDSKRSSEIKGEEKKEEAPTLPLGIDQEDPKELAKLYFALEYYVKSSNGGRGRCEFVIGEKSNPLVAVEVKTNKIDVATGVYQCFAYLLLLLQEDRKNRNLPTVPLWGIVTDYDIWQIVKLEGNIITKSKSIHLFVEDRGMVLVLLFYLIFSFKSFESTHEDIISMK